MRCARVRSVCGPCAFSPHRAPILPGSASSSSLTDDRASGERLLATVEDVLGGNCRAALDAADQNVVAGLHVGDSAGLAGSLPRARGVAQANLGVRVDG